MAIYILFGLLAAIGAMSVLWIIFGGLLPGARGGAVVCLGWPEEGFLVRYRWLRDLGLLRCPLVIVTESPLEGDTRKLSSGMELCSRDALLQRLEQERTDLDGTGNGDPPGRYQRRGISEL